MQYNQGVFQFQLLAETQDARAGEFETPHGKVKTPIFMPVGTQATVKALDSQDIKSIGAEIILGNTYHLYLRPGEQTIESGGGLHDFMQWRKPMLTDSGGFQILSLGDLLEQKNQNGRAAIVTDHGVEFTSHIDGTRHHLTPERSIEIQQRLGSDIMMVLDDVVSDKVPYARAKEAVQRSIEWAERCISQWELKDKLSSQGKYQALFGIVQGARFRDLREQSAEWILQQDFDGIAIGGESIGYSMEATEEIMTWLNPLLPKDKPRYAMGLGRDPQNIIDAVRWGFDMFDCVGPSRLARNGALFVGRFEGSNDPSTWKFESEFAKGRLSIGQARWKQDFQVLDENCACPSCAQGYTRAYLHHLFKTGELAYYRLATIHNLFVMLSISHRMQELLVMGHNGTTNHDNPTRA